MHFRASGRQVCWGALLDKCNTSYDLASLFRGRRKTLDSWSGKIAKRNGTRPSAQHSTFQSLADLLELKLSSSKVAEVLQTCFLLFSLKIEDVSGNYFVLDVANLKG